MLGTTYGTKGKKKRKITKRSDTHTRALERTAIHTQHHQRAFNDDNVVFNDDEDLSMDNEYRRGDVRHFGWVRRARESAVRRSGFAIGTARDAADNIRGGGASTRVSTERRFGDP